MFKIPMIRLWAAALCLLALAVPVGAAEVESGSVYCFTAADFSQDAALSGVCITAVPDKKLGVLCLGSRTVQSGDILTAAQAEQLTFSPVRSGEDRVAQIQYLPIYETYVAPCTAMTISIRGKEDKAPVAEDSAAETYKNLPNTGKLKVSDPEGLALTYTVTRQPKRGSVTLQEDGSFTYTPKKNKVGVDSFTFTAADPAGNVSREATVTVTILKPGDAAQYTDTAGRECRFAAEWMKHTGIFVGECLGDSSCFQPDKEVTRGEFVTMLVKALDIPTDEHLTYTGYSDEIPTWLQPYLAAAIRSGLTAGLPQQDVFGANSAITGSEAAVMLQNALDLSVSQDVIAREDAAPQWAQLALTVLQEKGIHLVSDRSLTRETAAQTLYQVSRLAETNTVDTLV